MARWQLRHFHPISLQPAQVFDRYVRTQDVRRPSIRALHRERHGDPDPFNWNISYYPLRVAIKALERISSLFVPVLFSLTNLHLPSPISHLPSSSH